uniref:NADH dehydrogenase subunit 4 n=1 Tax=Gotra octocincta TaxID=3029099 RepID=UPI0023D88689|nr:NADH dehydrogenase subunit 4 [Gotra octocincta]WDQ40359.1 NADH dehydrogenase subunit 4 [Gotra octocincta]
MMKFLILLMFSFFLNKMSYYLIAFIYQNILFLMLFFMLIMYPMGMSSWTKIYYNLGWDYYSFGLILLSVWILGLMMMVSVKLFQQLSYPIYFSLMNFMLLVLLICFSSMNVIMFYVTYETSLIPIFILVLGWGAHSERVGASYYMMLYTLTGSYPFFHLITIMYSDLDSLMFMFAKISYLNFHIYWMMIVAFLVKMPMYFFHLWLPKAHVEAPLVGSMILAGIMLKLGGYGILRFMPIMINNCLEFNKYIMIISLIGGVHSSLICLCQIDLKSLVAYSSVVHMSIMMSGMMTMYSMGYLGGFLMMIAHGLCSSGLFCLVNINYERLGSRSIMLNKGMINFFPSLSLLWFLLCSSNLSFPPSLNFFSEIMLLNSLLMWDNKLILILVLILFFSASYTLYLYSSSQHGLYSKLLYMFKMVSVNDYLVIILHWAPLNIVFMYMYMYL